MREAQCNKKISGHFNNGPQDTPFLVYGYGVKRHPCSYMVMTSSQFPESAYAMFSLGALETFYSALTSVKGKRIMSKYTVLFYLILHRKEHSIQ